MTFLRNWLQQPTTVAGLSAAFGTIVGLILQQVSLTQAIPLLIGAAVSIVLPDNAGARQQAELIANQVVDGIRIQVEKSNN